jgi:hypothetical protein
MQTFFLKEKNSALFESSKVQYTRVTGAASFT